MLFSTRPSQRPNININLLFNSQSTKHLTYRIRPHYLKQDERG